MKEGYLGNLIVFLKKFCPFEAMKVTFFSPFHSLVSIGKTTDQPIEKKGSMKNFDLGLIWTLSQGINFGK